MKRIKPKTWLVLSLCLVIAIIAFCSNYDQMFEDPATCKSLTIAMFVLLIASMTGAAAAYSKIASKKTQIDALMALNKINEELQLSSNQHHQTSMALQNQHELLNSIISAIPHCVFWKDADSVYKGCNKNFAIHKGFENCSDIIGKTDYNLARTTKEADFFVRCDNEIIKTGIPLVNMKETIRNGAGKDIKVAISKFPLHDIKGGGNGILGIYEYLSEARIAKSLLTSKKDSLSLAVNCMDQGLAVLDTEDKIAYANSYFANLSEIPIEQLIGKNICDCQGHIKVEPIQKAIQDFKDIVDCGTLEVQQELNGTDISVRIKPIYRDQKYCGAIINAIDISSLAMIKEQAEYADYRKSKFLENMSHEIRIPTSSIVGFAEILINEKLTTDQKEYVATILESSKELLDTIDKILDLSKIETGQITIEDQSYEEDIYSQINEINEINEAVDACANPVRDQIETDHQPSQPADSCDTTPSILIADDVEENRILIKAILNTANYNVTLSCDGKDAVEKASQEKFDIILMDIQMPIMSGIEATKVIRNEGPNTRTPVIAITAHGSPENHAEFAEAGCDDCVPKPINRQKLLTKLDRFLKQAKQIETANNGQDITSLLADNRDYHKTIKRFIDNLPDRIEQMQQAFERDDLSDLAQKVHSLKGLGGFAGFPIYTEMAKSIEQAIRNNDTEKVSKELQEMAKLCEKTTMSAIICK